LCNNHNKCINYAKFVNFGWEALYRKYKSYIIEILDVCGNNICRLDLLRQFDQSTNILTWKLQLKNHCQLPPNAPQLRNSLKDIFPDADPIYLDLAGEMYAFDQDGLSEFISKNTTKNKSYPKLQDYNDRIKFLRVIKSLKDNFQVKDFLSMCPDPVNYFNNIKINSNHNHYAESLSYLCNK